MMNDTVKWDNLLKQATKAREHAYAPYSGYKVGAALLTSGGKIYTGCNVENVAYPSCICAEHVAITKAVSEGERDFTIIAIVTAKGETPCGICRQVMQEFAPELTVVVGNLAGNYRVFTLPDLLPYSFEGK